MYQVNKASSGAKMIVKDGKYWIPEYNSNVAYQEYLTWLAEGNVAEDFEIGTGDN